MEALNKVGSNYSVVKESIAPTNSVAHFWTFEDYMNVQDKTRYIQYWKQVEQGLSAEQRYNYIRYGNTNGYYNPLENIPYTEKVLDQIREASDYYHSFPSAVDAFGGDGKVTTFISGDNKKIMTKIEIPGYYRGKKGTFEYMIEPSGEINHRFFNANK